MRPSLGDTFINFSITVAAGALFGAAALVIVTFPLSPVPWEGNSPFLLWAGFIWSMVGGAAFGLGFLAAAIITCLMSSPTEVRREANIAAICGSALFGGATAGLLLVETASLIVLGGIAIFALGSAAATYIGIRRRTPVPSGV